MATAVRSEERIEMMIETKRLKIYPAAREQMEAFIAAEADSFHDRLYNTDTIIPVLEAVINSKK